MSAAMRATRADKVHKRLHPKAKAPIAAEYEDCVQVLQQITDCLGATPTSSSLHRLSSNWQMRLTSWGLRSGASSRLLDHALRSSAKLGEQTLRLLKDLHAILDDTIAVVGAIDFAAPEGHSAAQGSIESSSHENDVTAEDPFYTRRPESYFKEIAEIVRCLVRLLASIGDPVEDDTQAEPVQSKESDEFYESLAKRVFPKAPPRISQTLKEYRQEKLASWDPSTTTDSHPAPRRLVLSSSAPRQAPSRQSALSDDLLSHGFHFLNSISENSGVSAVPSNELTSASATMFQEEESATSFFDGYDGSQAASLVASLLPPEPPVDLAEGKEFDCPYCHFELPLALSDEKMDAQKWVDHINQDLRPYFCTFGGCQHEHRPFATKRQWFEHELACHRSQQTWICGVCKRDFSARTELESHLREEHKLAPSKTLSSVLRASRRYSTTTLTQSYCGLCGQAPGIGRLEQHVSHHLEAFAMGTLPDADPEEKQTKRKTDNNRSLIDVERYLDNLTDRGGVLSKTNEHSRTALGVERVAGSRNAFDSRDFPGVTDRNDAVHQATDASSYSQSIQIQRFVEDDAQPHGEETNETVLSSVPAPLEKFAGRNNSLREMAERFSGSGVICSISGRSGIGKTCLAAKFVHDNQPKFRYIFWVNAKTEALCGEQYRAIAKHLHIRDSDQDSDSLVYKIRDRLTVLEPKWLLVFDNVRSWNDLERYVPRPLQKTRGSVLILTQLKDPLSVPRKITPPENRIDVTLDVWSLDSAAAFLLMSTHSWDLRKEDLLAHPEYELAPKIVNLVGRLPLAISIIVGYIKVEHCKLQDFLDLWEDNGPSTEAKTESEIDAAVEHLWTIGIKEINWNSRRLLEILAFYDPRSIQKSLLIGQHSEEYLRFLSSAETASKRAFPRMINELEGRRLIARIEGSDEGDEAFFLPTLIRNKLLLDLKRLGFSDAFRNAFRLVRKAFPEADSQQVPHIPSFAVCQRYITHVQNVRSAFVQMAPPLNQMSDPKPLEIAQLLYDAGFYVWARGTTGHQSTPLLETALRILDETGADPNAKIRADIMCMMGLDLLDAGCGDRKKALEVLERVWGIRKVNFELDDSHDNDVLLQNAAADYALALLDEHRFAEAKTIFKSTRERYELWGGEDNNPWEFGKYYGNHCIVLMIDGKMTKAIEHAKKSVELARKFSGDKGSLYYERKFTLGCILMQTQDFQAALNEHLEVLAARMEILGKHHYFTILSMYAVGTAYYHLDQKSSDVWGTEWMRKALEYGKDRELDEAMISRIKYRLALLYRRQGLEPETTAQLEADAKETVKKWGSYAAKCVHETEDIMMILHDIQPTFTGRYTGRSLVPKLQQMVKEGLSI